MSSEALAWAFKQDVKPSGAKFTLVALCECANYKTGRIMPSIAHLVEITGQDRKTIINHIDQLVRQGFITDTGERTGTTKQIKVYSAAIGTVPQPEQSQERNSSTSLPKQSQKRDTEPSLEPSSPTDATHLPVKKRVKAYAFPCPNDVDPIDWRALIDNRKAKRAALTEGAHRQITRKLDEWARDGWPPGPIVAFAAERGWTTVFETDEMKARHNERTNLPRNPGGPNDRRDGVAKALDRRLGFDFPAGETGRRDAGQGSGHSQRALAALGPG